MCVCVCVSEREKERERKMEKEKINVRRAGRKTQGWLFVSINIASTYTYYTSLSLWCGVALIPSLMLSFGLLT